MYVINSGCMELRLHGRNKEWSPEIPYIENHLYTCIARDFFGGGGVTAPNALPLDPQVYAIVLHSKSSTRKKREIKKRTLTCVHVGHSFRCLLKSPPTPRIQLCLWKIEGDILKGVSRNFSKLQHNHELPPSGFCLCYPLEL